MASEIATDILALLVALTRIVSAGMLFDSALRLEPHDAERRRCYVDGSREMAFATVVICFAFFRY